MVAMRRVDRRSSSLTWPPNEISADSRSSDGLVIICPEPSLRLRSMDTVPAGAVRRSEGGEVPMELTLVRATNRRFQMWIPLLLAFGFVLVAAQPLAASMLVSRTQASPGDNVTFWIWITPLKEKARNLIVTESNLDGFVVVSSEAPGSCMQTQLTWVCVQDELRPFAIGVHVVPGSGTEGKDLVNEARVQVWDKGEHDDEESHGADPISVSAAVHVVAAPKAEEAQIGVQLSSTRADVVPDSLQNYRVDVTNRGNSTANHVSVVVSVPESITLVSAS